MPARVMKREWLQLHLSEHGWKWAVAVVYLAAYIILEWASFIHVHKGLPITPWDPGLGVAFALMIRGGPLSGLILFAGNGCRRDPRPAKRRRLADRHRSGRNHSDELRIGRRAGATIFSDRCGSNPSSRCPHAARGRACRSCT